MMGSKQEPTAIKYTWNVHINEDFIANIQSPSVEGAILQALAQYYQKHAELSLVYDINIVNATLHAAQQATDSILVEGKEQASADWEGVLYVTCSSCGKRFKNEHTLQQHKNKFHAKGDVAT